MAENLNTEIITPEKQEYLDNIEQHNNFPRKRSGKTCNGKIHRQFRYCRKEAGWGTDHLGKGRCKLHGGSSTGPHSGKLLYSDFVPAKVVELYENFTVMSPQEIKSLNNEIAIIRSKIAFLERKGDEVQQRNEQKRKVGLQPEEKFEDEDIYDRNIVGMIELLRRCVETKQKVEEEIKSKVTIEIVLNFTNEIIKIIDELINDKVLKVQLAQRMRGIQIPNLN